MSHSKEELMSIAGTTTSLTRQFNTREGVDASFDKLPKRFFKKNENGASISRGKMAVVLEEYNDRRG
jgi:aldehyde:ferredoxin oxidoreductase